MPPTELELYIEPELVPDSDVTLEVREKDEDGDLYWVDAETGEETWNQICRRNQYQLIEIDGVLTPFPASYRRKEYQRPGVYTNVNPDDLYAPWMDELMHTYRTLFRDLKGMHFTVYTDADGNVIPNPITPKDGHKPGRIRFEDGGEIY